MKQVVKQYDKMNDVFGEPQPYTVVRDNTSYTLNIHPFKLMDYNLYNEYIPLLTINKNVLGLDEAISSSYLKFMLMILPEISIDQNTSENDRLNSINSNREFYLKTFYNLIRDITHTDLESIRVEFVTKNREFNRWKVYFFIEGVKYTENDFQKMIKIILSQNGIQQPDFEIYDAELQKELDEANQWMAEKNNGATLDEQIFAYHVATGISFAEIKKYTFYQFNKAIDRAIVLKDYEVLKPLEASGQIEIKGGKIDHWLAHRSNNNKYGGVTSDKATLTSMLGDVSVMD